MVKLHASNTSSLAGPLAGRLRPTKERPASGPAKLGRAVYALLLLFICFEPVRAGTLTTLDGKTFEGQISFEKNDTLLVSPKNAPPQQIELANVLNVSFITENRPLLRGVLLTSGEAIAANAITQLDSSGVRLVRPGGIPVTLPAADLACVFFRPVSADMFRHVPPGHAGAILDNGDFFEGDPAGFDGNQVKISSVLFGIQSFDVGHAARAVVVQDAVAPDADEVVHLVDGTVLLGKTVSCSAGRLSVDDARLGPITLETRLVARMNAGGSAFDSLCRIAPSEVDGSPVGYAIDSTVAGVPMALLGITPSHCIGQRPGVSLTWNLNGKYKSVIARAGVPIGLVPLQRLQFVVLTDGKEAFRSAPQSSIDDPATVAMNLAGAKTLTLRVDGAEALAPGATGLWADPILVIGSGK